MKSIPREPDSAKRCLRLIYPLGEGDWVRQCSFKRGQGKGGRYCGVHARKMVQARA